MPQIILKERTAHLGSYTFFTRDVEQYKNTSLSQLYQLPFFTEHLSLATFVLWILQSFEEQLFHRTPPGALLCRCSSR